MASNGSLMTVPDFPNRLRELKARGGRMVVFDPRRTETAKVATEHHFVRPGTDAFVLLAMVQVLFAEGLTRPPSYVDGLDAVDGRRRRLHPRARRGRAAACPPRRSAGSPASSRRPTAPWPTAGSGSRRTRSAPSASGRSSCSTC